MVGVLECWSIGVMNWILGTPNIYGNTQLCNFNTPILHCSSTPLLPASILLYLVTSITAGFYLNHKKKIFSA